MIGLSNDRWLLFSSIWWWWCGDRWRPLYSSRRAINHVFCSNLTKSRVNNYNNNWISCVEEYREVVVREFPHVDVRWHFMRSWGAAATSLIITLVVWPFCRLLGYQVQCSSPHLPLLNGRSGRDRNAPAHSSIHYKSTLTTGFPWPFVAWHFNGHLRSISLCT